MLRKLVGITLLLGLLVLILVSGGPMAALAYFTVSPIDSSRAPVVTRSESILPAPTVSALQAAATPAPSSPSNPQTIDAPGAAWKAFVSPNYRYSIAYPSDWTVSVENAGTMDDAIEIERVSFKQPNYGTPNQSSTVIIEAAQHGYATEGQCQGPTEVIPGIRGCRRSFPKVQNVAQEIVWFQPPLGSAGAQPYFDVQLVYDDAKYVVTFNQMLANFKYTGALLTASPQGDGGLSGDIPPDAPIVVPGAATATPAVPWKTFASARHGYVVSYPADWTIDVQTSGGGRDPEYVYLRSAATNLPMVSIYALKDVPPITGFESCDKNLQFRGVLACSIALPKGQIPATRLLIFQKGDSYYQIGAQYDEQQQLGVFDEIVKSFQFTP